MSCDVASHRSNLRDEISQALTVGIHSYYTIHVEYGLFIQLLGYHLTIKNMYMEVSCLKELNNMKESRYYVV